MEEHFEIPTRVGSIRGMLHRPSAVQSNSPSVIIVHGYFSANRVGPARLYVQVARHLCEQGLHVVRADFLGVGESDGAYSEITFDSECRDLNTVIDSVRRWLDDSPLVLIGHSMGANLALKVTRDRGDISKLILLAPDVEKQGGIDRLFDNKQLEELETRDWTIRKGLHINRSFIDELRSNRPYELAKAIEIPVLVVQGDADELYSLDGAKKLAGCAKCGGFEVVHGADHNFLWPSSRQALLEKISETLL